MQLSEQEKGRRESLLKLRELGIDPYPAAEFNYTHTLSEIKKDFKEGEEKGGRKNGVNIEISPFSKGRERTIA